MPPSTRQHRQTTLQRMCDVQGNTIKPEGVRRIPLMVGPGGDEGMNAKAYFRMGPVGEPLLSMGQLLRKGFDFNLSLAKGMYMSKGDKFVPMFLERSSLKVEATCPRIRSRQWRRWRRKQSP